MLLHFVKKTGLAMVSRGHARGALLGLFVGDAAGATLEFTRGSITAEIARRAMLMPGGGVLRVGPGQITDDSELAMALCHALSHRDPSLGLPTDAIAHSYKGWLDSNPFDVGGTCYTAFSSSSSSGTLQFPSSDQDPSESDLKLLEEDRGLARAMRAAAAEFSGSSEANGALMRIVPMAIWLAGESSEIVAQAAKEDARLSHPNPVCQECNAVYSLTVAHLLSNAGDRIGALDLAEEYALNHMHTKARDWLLKESIDVTHLTCTSMIGHVRYAFTLAFFFLRQAASFEDAISLTLQKGGDTDTNAAIVGGLLGAFHGAENIPAFMKDPVLSFDCSSCNQHPRTGHTRPLAYSTRHIEELLDGLLMRNASV
ncbi:hypothetical protein GOP47_0025739 [Adiantum capillus-veneris]|uniref:ADP-ribosyl-[dinitrogen reductase] glycohydrolase n=1 Tax=Adiantum capillus-veneris TaxID=13818 RepID=A0A9D4U125_ADICA|nr:hypothetical protein GOP47_0025739 [Adiantum capillus-veneris]